LFFQVDSDARHCDWSVRQSLRIWFANLNP
jgi:hypothetical protein